jgi:hypothetical protein
VELSLEGVGGAKFGGSRWSTCDDRQYANKTTASMRSLPSILMGLKTGITKSSNSCQISRI